MGFQKQFHKGEIPKIKLLMPRYNSFSIEIYHTKVKGQNFKRSKSKIQRQLSSVPE